MSDDRLGTLNHIDPAKVLSALRLVRKGEVIALNAPLDATATAVLGRPPLRRTARQHNELWPLGDERFAVINDDVVEFALQGSSHWDSFAHFGLIEPGVDGVFYGGAGLDETQPEASARRLGIDAFAGGIVTRGVLLDALGVLAGPDAEHLPDETTIGAAEIRRCLAEQGVALERGDVVLVFTGFERRLEKPGFGDAHAGLDATTLEVWREAGIAGLVADNIAVEITPADLSLHVGALRDMGLPLGELWALERLAHACRADGVYDFLLVSVPLNIPGAFGSPANAVAIR